MLLPCSIPVLTSKYNMEAAGEYPAEIYMGLTQILLIVLGVAIFVASFLVPEKLNKEKIKEVKIPEEKIQDLIKKEIKQAEYLIEEKTEETISAATQKAERYMERISNEKIMAVQEYSDTVLGQINKNHEEAVFLYDMLNNKHIQIKNTAAEISSKVECVKAELENSLLEQALEIKEEEVLKVSQGEHVSDKVILEQEEVLEIDIELEPDMDEDAGSNKDKILQLHEEGKSNIEIAKSLGLGIGEVKLIIDLFENAES